MRSFSNDIKPLSWDEFRKEATQLGEKIDGMIKESNGHLDRMVAENLVDEIVNLRRAHPLRNDDLLPTEDFEDMVSDPMQGVSTSQKTAKKPLVEHYECLFILASSCQDSRLVLLLYHEIAQRKIEMTSVMLNAALKTCVIDCDVVRAKTIYESEEAKGSIDAMTLVYMMQAYTALGDKKGMERIYMKLGEMVSNETVVRGDLVRRIIASYLIGLVQIGYPSIAVQVYESIFHENPSLVKVPPVLRAMIEAYSDLRNFFAAIQTFEILVEDNAQIPHSTIARVIYCYLCAAQSQTKSAKTGKSLNKSNDNHSDSTQKFEAKAKDLYSFIEKNSTMARAWPWDRFLQLTQSKEGLPRATPLSEDTTLLQVIKEKPTQANYEAALTHFATAGDLVIAEKILRSFNKRFPDVPITPKMSSALFQGSTRLGNSKYVSQFENLDDEKAKISPSLARHLLNYYITKGDAIKTTDLFGKVLSRYPSIVEPSTCEAVLKLFVGAPSFLQSRGIALFYQLLEIFPDSTLTTDFFNIAMTVFTHTTNPKGISVVLEQIKKRQLTPNARTYTALMELYLRKPDYKLVMATYAQMIEAKISPDTGGIMALIVALGESKALAEAKTVLFLQEQLEIYDVEPSEELLEVLKKATMAARNPGAFGLLLRVLTRKHGLSLNAGNYTAWLSALIQCDQLKRALELATHLVEESRRRPELLTVDFCYSLALFVSKEAGDDLKQESVLSWIKHTGSGNAPLNAAERLRFEKDLSTWHTLFPEDNPTSFPFKGPMPI